MNNLEVIGIAKYEKIGSLSLIKFLFAFIVFLFHWNIHFSVVYSNTLINNFINAGAFVMSGFFALSGYLLYYIYSNKNFSDFSYLKNFYIKRAVKILPSCYLMLVIMLFWYYLVMHKSVNWVLIIQQIIPLQAFFPNMFGEFLNGGFWFISVLLFLYFLFPLLCFIVKSVKHIFCFSVCVYILGIFPLILNCYYPDISLYFLPYFRICEFLAGMVAARIFICNNNKSKYHLLFSIITLIGIFFSVSLLYSQNFFHHTKFSSGFMYYDTVLLILFPILFYNLGKIKNKSFLNIMQSKIVDYFGNISYSFFLTQALCVRFVDDVLIPNKYFGLNSTNMLVISFLLNIFLAVLLYECFEKRITKMLQNTLIK